MMIRMTLTILAALLLVAQPAFANMARPWIQGQFGGEPSGIPGVHVVHEDLHFEMSRGVWSSEASDRVTAEYLLRNDGSALSSPLQFVAVGITDASEISVRVNGEQVPVTVEMDHPIPPEWRLPETTPIPGGGEAPLALPIQRKETAPSILFDADFAGGENRIAVTYETTPAGQPWGDFWLRQTVYVLSPAKSWESFGTMNITVRPPSGHEIASSLPLEKSDGMLSASFDGVPADALVITTQRKPPLGSLLLFYLFVFGGVLVACGLAPFVVMKLWKRPIAAGVVTVLVVAAGGFAGISAVIGTPGPSQGPFFNLFVMVVMFGAAAIVGGVATLMAWARSSA